jgi:hypothetical protein
MRQKCLAERFKQGAVDRIALRIVFRMPLHAERKARRIGNPNRFDGAVLRGALDDHALAGFENSLTMQRVDPDRLAAEQPRKGAAGDQADVMAVGENDGRIGMDFTVLEPRHPMIDASWQLADLRMQRTAEGDVHLLQAAADPEQRNAAGDADLRQRQRHFVAMQVVGFVG